MTFLAAWTQRLHELGYASGVYSSSASGIADLAHRWGTSFTSPDNIWSANWNGRADTEDPNLSARTGRTTSGSTSTGAATTRSGAASGSTSTATTSTR